MGAEKCAGSACLRVYVRISVRVLTMEKTLILLCLALWCSCRVSTASSKQFTLNVPQVTCTFKWFEGQHSPVLSSKVKGGNLEQQVIWNSQVKSSVNHKLHPLFPVSIISMNGEFGSSKDGWVT